MKKSDRFFAGLSGIQLPVPKYRFPPEHYGSSRLTYYATFFNSIEVNSSFYKIPMRSTITRWAASVPEEFRFTFKLFREVTHAKHLNFDSAHILRFLEAISFIGNRKGCLLVQLPPGLLYSGTHSLASLLETIRNEDPSKAWPIAVEFRNKDWYNDEILELLTTYDATLVKHDIKASATPFISTSSGIVYVRFHGPTGNYRGSYPEAFLQEYSGYVEEWLSEGKTVYVYFNNTAGDAFNNLSSFNKLLLQ